MLRRPMTKGCRVNRIRQIAAVAMLALLLPASALAAGRRPSISLYPEAEFRGPRILLTTDVSDLRWYGFRDRAKSLRIIGRWEVCEKVNFGGRCTIADANMATLDGSIASVRVAK